MKVCTGIHCAHLLLMLIYPCMHSAPTIKEIAFEVDRIWERSSKTGLSPPDAAGCVAIIRSQEGASQSPPLTLCLCPSALHRPMCRGSGIRPRDTKQDF